MANFVESTDSGRIHSQRGCGANAAKITVVVVVILIVIPQMLECDGHQETSTEQKPHPPSTGSV